MPILASRSLHVEPTFVLDAATQAWVVAVVSNGGSVSDTRKAIVNTLITGLKTDSIWTKLDRLWLFAAENTASALTDLVATSLATEVSSPIFTIDRGYAGNGSSSYIETNFNASTAGGNFVRDSASLFGWNNTSGTSSQPRLVSMGTDNQVTVYFTDTNDYWRVNDSVNLQVVAGTGATGLYLANRSAGNTQQFYRNDTQVDTDTSASTAVPNRTMQVDSVEATFFGDRQCSCAGAGGSLSSTEVANLYTRLRTYMTALGVP